MSAADAATVVVANVHSLSFTGTTWLNILMGSHPTCFTLGPPDRAWRMDADDAAEACIVHRADCEFWPRFLRGYDRDRNYFVQLAEASGCRIVVLNNPTPALAERELDHPSVDVRHVTLVRDGRAVLASLLRQVPDRYASAYDAVRGWLEPALRSLETLVPPDAGHSLFLRFEDAARDPRAALDRIGELLGIHYPENALRYWEHTHHLAAGNWGAVSVLRRLQGLAGLEDWNETLPPFYDEIAERTRAHPEQVHVDDSWTGVLGRDDRIAYDYLVGELHAAVGYERDRFTVGEITAFLRAHGLPLDAAAAPAELTGPAAAAAAGPPAARAPLLQRLAWRIARGPARGRDT